MDGKFLLLQGDGNADLGPPQPIFLPTTLINKNLVAVMIETQFSTAITQKGAGCLYPLLDRNAVTMSETIMQLAPIPPYFVYDGFEQDLDTALVLERIIGVNSNQNDMFTHLSNFLWACLSSHNPGDRKLYIGGTALSAALSMPARQWAKTRFSKAFPTLVFQA